MTHDFPGFRSIPLLLSSILLIPFLTGQDTGPKLAPQDVASTYVAKALPGGKEALTWPKFYAARFRWMRNADLDAYRKHGVRNSKWDDVVISAIHALHDLISGKTPATRESLDSAYAGFTKAHDLGCEGPRVLYAVGRVQYMAGDYEEFLKTFARTRKLYRERGYPVAFEFRLQRFLCSRREMRRDPEKLRKNNERLARLYGRAFGDTQNKNGNQRYWLTTMYQTWRGDDDIPTDLAPILAGIREAKDPAPWLVAFFHILQEVDLAYKARGDKWASEVTEKQWAGLRTHLQAAKKHALEAYRLRPEFPEPAAQMLSILVGLDEPGLRKWFDRSVAAHFDYRSAYYKYIWALQPRWGGTNEALLAFGTECMKTNRHDTTVPSMLDRAIGKIVDDLDSYRAAFLMKGAYESYKELVAGILASPPYLPKETVKNYQAKLCLAGFVTGHRDESAQTYRSLRKPLNDNLVRSFGLKSSSVVRILEKRLAKQESGSTPEPKKK